MGNKINRTELEAKLRGLEGLSQDEKSALIELLHQKRYGLVWENKPEDVEEKLRMEIPVLKERKELALTEGGADAPNHILIEGDNLEALTALSYTHENAIDVIYIDPPYNTGNKDFVYNDSFVDSEDDYRHSKWLSFMSKRLKIAKSLLSDNGVIFISIDDNEMSQLKLLCDEVFISKNFIAKFDWRKKTGANDAKDIAIITESVLLYGKDKQKCVQNQIWNRDLNSVNINRYKLSDEFEEERGLYYLDTLDRGGLQYSDSLNYGIVAPDGGVIFPNGRDHYENDGWIWKWGEEKVQWGIENKFIEFVESKKSIGSKYTVKYKVYQFVDNEGNLIDKKGRAYSNLIIDPINQIGKTDLSNVFEGKTVFSNPKPLGLVQYLFNTLNKNTLNILDFFAGSGTTLHATMQLNAEDGGKRKCILVTNNENNICEEVTYERNKRVIQGYTTPKGVEVEGLKNNNLRYYQVDSIPRESSITAKREFMKASTDLLCIKNDIYREVEILGEWKLRANVARFFEEGERRMLIIYTEDAFERIVEELKSMEVKEKILVYVFSVNNYAMDADFEEVADKVQLCALPTAIYNAYLKVLPKKRIVKQTTEEENV